MTPRLVGIATRRNVGLWSCPFNVAFCLFIDQSLGLGWSLILWPDMSVIVGKSVLVIGPCIAGAAAWMAGREHRCGLDNLLATTPRPAFARRAATWAGTVVWGLLAYLAAGAILLSMTLRHAIWGGPTLWPMLVGLLAVPAYATVGFAVGAAIPERFTAPFIAIFMLMAEIILGLQLAAAPGGLATLSYLSAAPFLDTSVWYGIRPNVGLPQGLSMLSLIALSLGLLALRADTRDIARAVLGGGLALAAASVIALIVAAPPRAVDLKAARVTAGSQDPAFLPYSPACLATLVPVCMHPAYRMYLRGDAATINRLVAPLRGIPGAPVRAAQTPGAQGVFAGSLDFILSDLPTVDASMPSDLSTDPSFFGPVAVSLVRDSAYGAGPDGCSSYATVQSCRPAQEAIGIWLVRQAGLRLALMDIGHGRGYPYFGNDWVVASAAAQRFAALSPAHRHAWLRAHYLALRRGQIALGTLP